MTENRFLIAGAGGRMGCAVIRAAVATPGVTLAGGIDRPDGPAIGSDLGPLAGLDAVGLRVTEIDKADFTNVSAIIDFSTPSASADLARRAASNQTPIVIGSTGFSADEEAIIKEASNDVAIVKSGNMSLGVNLLAALIQEAAKRLDPDDFDIEIIEAHHRAKVDAPSGTALMLGEAAAVGRRVSLDDVAAHDRRGQRKVGDIGFAVVRGGGIIGEHEAVFASDQEIIELKHKAIDRSLFAKGAIRAAIWLSQKWVTARQPGMYDMGHVLEFKN
ncbi:MAG: 4-hydroxy-tetrahydrodipicolinate reductase [Pseudomonadota bacterium]